MKLRSKGRRLVALCYVLAASVAVLYVALAWPSMQGG